VDTGANIDYGGGNASGHEFWIDIDLSTQIVTRRLDVACHPKRSRMAEITELYMVQGTRIAEAD